MKDMTTVTEGDLQSIVIGLAGTCLIFNGRLVQGIATYSTRICTYIPRPHRHSTPFYPVDRQERQGEWLAHATTTPVQKILISENSLLISKRGTSPVFSPPAAASDASDVSVMLVAYTTSRTLQPEGTQIGTTCWELGI